MEAKISFGTEHLDIENMFDRIAKATGGSCMAIIPKEYEGRKVKVLILKEKS